ncbi:hypothetical protein K3495_g15502, partial [Podosphaera aphanis]
TPPMPVFVTEKTIVPPHSRKLVPVSPKKDYKLPAYDLIYEPIGNQAFTAFPQIISGNCTSVLVQNESSLAVQVPEALLIGHIVETEAERMTRVDESDVFHLMALPNKNLAYSRVLTKGSLAALADITNYTADAFTTAPTPSFSCVESQTLPKGSNSLKLQLNNCPNNSAAEIALANGVTAYGNPQQLQTITDLIHEFEALWVDQKRFAISPIGEMSIDLVDNWETKYKPGQARVYNHGIKERKLIDATFDALHDQKSGHRRLYWTKNATPFSFPVFVVWRTVNGVQKGRVVIDIRALNHILMPDAYPIPTQEEILTALAGSAYISTVDCASFFYQWKVKPEHQHRLTVSSHRGQETFACAVMGCRNSVAYVQRTIDTVLREERKFARAYIDDIVIFSKTFRDHALHLRAVFSKLKKHFIHLSPKKCFINYPSVDLLGQRVDALGLSSDKEKLAAIANLQFPRTLKQ